MQQGIVEIRAAAREEGRPVERKVLVIRGGESDVIEHDCASGVSVSIDQKTIHRHFSLTTVVHT